MKCIICHSEDIQVKDVKEEIHFQNNIIYVNVQANVCHSCGERYYNRNTVRYLEDTEEKIKSSHFEFQEVGKVLEYKS